VGIAAADDGDDLVFISRGAQLLRFPASAVRPQGRTAGGMAGIKLSAGDTVLHFGAVAARDGQAVVVTVASPGDALPGTTAGSVKVTEFAEYPAKGRGTAGVRAHRFLRGEEALALAWAGHGPARAASANGVARALPTEHGRRDGSGVPLTQQIDAVGPSLLGLIEASRPEVPSAGGSAGAALLDGPPPAVSASAEAPEDDDGQGTLL